MRKTKEDEAPTTTARIIALGMVVAGLGTSSTICRSMRISSTLQKSTSDLETYV